MTNDRILNNIFSVSFKPLLDLLFSLSGATPKLAVGSLGVLIAAAANRASLTFAASEFKTLLQVLGARLNVNINPVVSKVPRLYEISAFLKNLEIDAVLKTIQKTLEDQILLAERFAWLNDFSIQITDEHVVESWIKKNTLLITSIAPRKKNIQKGSGIIRQLSVMADISSRISFGWMEPRIRRIMRLQKVWCMTPLRFHESLAYIQTMLCSTLGFLLLLS